MQARIQHILGDLIRLDSICEENGILRVKFFTPQLTMPLLHVIQSRLSELGYRSEVESIDKNTEDEVTLKLSLISDRSANEPKQTWRAHPAFHLALFLVTFSVVFLTGATWNVNQPLIGIWYWEIGLKFSFSLMGILTAHEFGHYFAARYHGLHVSLPYYLPSIVIPPYGDFGGTTFMPGTFGAFIRVKSPIRTKRELMDVGAAGPIAGFIVCLVILIYGFWTIPEKTYAYQFYDPETLYNGQTTLTFGKSVLFDFLGWALAGDRMPEMYDIIHYPFIFAGWFGLLITALNLLPVGQLDGGHIIYAMIGKNQKWFAYAAVGGILFLGVIYGATNWFIWAILIFLVIKIKHPPVVNEEEPLDRNRIVIGFISMLILILSFMPTPVFEMIITK